MITFIDVFTVLPEKQQDALRIVRRVYDEVVRHQPGFISAKLLMSNDGLRVTAIAQWETEASLRAMRQIPLFRDLHNEEFFEAIVSNDGHIYNASVEIETLPAVAPLGS